MEDLFEFIIVGYCAMEQKDWWTDFTEKERLEFWDTYIYPFFDSTNANIFLENEIKAWQTSQAVL